jgi:hypothetical protein
MIKLPATNFQCPGSFRGEDIFIGSGMINNIPISSPAINMADMEISILSLFYAMGGRIPKFMIDRANSSQQRWTEHGDVLEVKLQDAGLHQELMDLLSDRTEFTRNIERLLSLSIIEVEVSTDSMESYVCQCEGARIFYDRNKVNWIRRAFELCYYVFPRRKAGEAS